MTLSELRSAFERGELGKDAYVAQMLERHTGLLEYADLLARTDVARIELSPGGVVVVLKDPAVRLCLRDGEDAHQTALTLLNFPGYESEELRVALALLERHFGERPFHALDVGANYGWLSLCLATRFPSATVQAFEPVPRTFAHLQANIAENGLEDRIQPHAMGLLETPGSVPFFYDPGISGRTSAARLVEDPGLQELRLPVSTVDAMAAVPVGFLKCDVEGAELRVLQGARRVLERDRPLILAEMLRKWARRFGYHPNDLIAFLAGFGYHCHRVREGRLVPMTAMDEDTPETNFFFLHQEAHAGLG